MQPRTLCKFFGAHEYQKIDEYDYKDLRGNIIGKIIVSRCIHCGDIKTVKIKTEED